MTKANELTSQTGIQCGFICYSASTCLIDSSQFKMISKLLRNLDRQHSLKIAQQLFYHSSSINSYSARKDVVDLRSDTFTTPTPEMRKAMANAKVGDDVYREDPTINRLEKEAAEVLGKEAALLLATGTMSNLAAVLAHCELRGSEIIVGDQSHIFLYEQGGTSTLGSVHVSTIPNNQDGTFSLESVKKKIRHKNMHQPTSRLLSIENTHNVCGGVIVPESFVRAARDICKENELIFHLDGARIMNVAAALQKPVHEICEPFDSVNMCLSKGLGAPMGSILAGTKDFIERARYWRKGLGGAWRQAGIVAAAGLISLHDIPKLLSDDHARAKRLHQGLKQILGDNQIIRVTEDPPHTNIVNVTINSEVINAEEIVEMMQQIPNEAVILSCAMSSTLLRFVTYYDLGNEDIERALNTLKIVFDKILSSNDPDNI